MNRLRKMCGSFPAIGSNKGMLIKKQKTSPSYEEYYRMQKAYEESITYKSIGEQIVRKLFKEVYLYRDLRDSDLVRFINDYLDNGKTGIGYSVIRNKITDIVISIKDY